MQYVHRVEDVKAIVMDPNADVGGGQRLGKKITLRTLSDPTVANVGLKNFTLNYVEYAPGGGTNPHSHPDFEQLFFVLSGEALMYIGGQEYKVKANSFAIMPPNIQHNVKVLGDEPFRFLELIAPAQKKENWKHLKILKE